MTICSKFSKRKTSGEVCKPGVREGAQNDVPQRTERPVAGEDTAFLLEFERSCPDRGSTTIIHGARRRDIAET